MSQEPPPLHYAPPPARRLNGCVMALIIVGVLLVVLVIGLWYGAMHTAAPFRLITEAIHRANPNIVFTGVSGSLSSGPSVHSITWGSDPANPSQILDLRIKYNGYSKARAENRLVIDDVGVRKAHIDIADFGSMHSTSTSTTTTSTGTTSSTSTPASGSSGSSTSESLRNLGFSNVEIRQVLIEDVLITNRASPFRLSIPKISWKGFKAAEGAVELGTLEIESDRLTVETKTGRSVKVGPEVITYQKAVTGTVQILAHPSLRQPVDFALDVSFPAPKAVPQYHFTTATDQIVTNSVSGGGHAIHVQYFEPAAFFDVKKLFGEEAAEFPSDLVVEATAPNTEAPYEVVSGSFRLGVTTFQIEPGSLKGGDGEEVLRAAARSGAGEIRWSLRLADFPNKYRPVLSSEPVLAPEEILAQVFAGKKYQDLAGEEKSRVDGRMEIYFGKNK